MIFLPYSLASIVSAEAVHSRNPFLHGLSPRNRRQHPDHHPCHREHHDKIVYRGEQQPGTGIFPVSFIFPQSVATDYIHSRRTQTAGIHRGLTPQTWIAPKTEPRTAPRPAGHGLHPQTAGTQTADTHRGTRIAPTDYSTD